MSASKAAEDTAPPPSVSSEDMMSALFAYLVTQQSNMAMMLLGKVAHPDTGKTMRDLDAAKLFIDQLEMLEVKTKGNLSKEEGFLLKQSLMSLRMAYVEAVESSPPSPQGQSSPTPTPAEPAKTAEPNKPKPESDTSAATEEEHRKKFTKKY